MPVLASVLGESVGHGLSRLAASGTGLTTHVGLRSANDPERIEHLAATAGPVTRRAGRSRRVPRPFVAGAEPRKSGDCVGVGYRAIGVDGGFRASRRCLPSHVKRAARPPLLYTDKVVNRRPRQIERRTGWRRASAGERADRRSYRRTPVTGNEESRSPRRERGDLDVGDGGGKPTPSCGPSTGVDSGGTEVVARVSAGRSRRSRRGTCVDTYALPPDSGSRRRSKRRTCPSEYSTPYSSTRWRRVRDTVHSSAS